MHAIQEGEIYLTRFTPAYRSEIRKIRPAIILRSENSSANPNLITIIPITSVSKGKENNFELKLKKKSFKALNKDSYALCWYVRTVDKARLMTKIGKLDDKTFKNIQNKTLSYLKGES